MKHGELGNVNIMSAVAVAVRWYRSWPVPQLS